MIIWSYSFVCELSFILSAMRLRMVYFDFSSIRSRDIDTVRHATWVCIYEHRAVPGKNNQMPKLASITWVEIVVASHNVIGSFELEFEGRNRYLRLYF